MIAVVLGILTWSFLEYLIHRWLGHDGRFQPNPFASEHTRHHGEGNYFAPSWKKGATAMGATVVMLWPAIASAGLVGGLAYVAGFVGMYLSYEICHRREHTHPGVGAWGRWLRRHHFHHHFGDPKSNHGVTSPIWDFVFGTYQAPGMVRVPRRLAMPWLVDPETGAVRDEHARHYEVVGAAR
jgi:sterol desaturase/sphingolipid hydroxylase (fatty acid hydroxylase superfamily)